MIIRKAIQSDSAAIQLITRVSRSQAYADLMPESVLEAYIKTQYSQETLTQKIAEEDVWVVSDGDLIVGYVMAHQAMYELKIAAMYVLPSSQHQGFGSAMLKHLEDNVSPQIKHLSIDLEFGNEIGSQFYEKAGFYETHRSAGTVHDHPVKYLHLRYDIKR